MHSPNNPNATLSPPAVVIIGPTGVGKHDLARDMVDLTGWQLFNWAQIRRQLEFENHRDGILGEVDPEAYSARVTKERRRLLATGRPLIFNGHGTTVWSETQSDIDAAQYDLVAVNLGLEPSDVATLPTARDVTPEEIRESYEDHTRFTYTDLDPSAMLIEVDQEHYRDRLQIAVESLQAYIEAYPKVE